MRWLIDATAARFSGALTDYLEILPVIDSLLDTDECRVLASPELSEKLRGRLKRIQIAVAKAGPGLNRYIAVNTSIVASIRYYRPDAVLFGLFSPLISVPSSYVLRMTQASLIDPVYRTCLRFLSFSQFLAFKVRQYAFRRSLRGASDVVCSTQATRDLLLCWEPRVSTMQIIASHFGPPWIANEGVRHAFYHNKRLLTMHALPHKNIELILSGMAKPALKDWTLTIMANLKNPKNRYERFLINEIERLGLGDRVNTIGYLSDRKQVAQCLANHDILVIPSRTETWSHAVVEGMAIGMPVIASDIACHREVTNGGAKLIPIDDARALVEAVQLINDDSYERNRLIERGYEVVNGFSWINHTLDILRALSATRKSLEVL